MPSSTSPIPSSAVSRSIRSSATVLLCVFLAFALLTGGSSRADALSQILIRPVSVLAIAAAWLALDAGSLRPFRAPLAGLLALAGLMVAQLVPLPPAIWTSLPGRELFASAADLLGVEQPWRPITISPSRTWNSLVSLLPPAAALLLLALVPPRRGPAVLFMLIVLLAASAVLGLAQRVGPDGGPLYLYSITNLDTAVGFFANRNHQAVILACLFPMLAAYTVIGSREGRPHPARMGIAAMGAASLIPLILATGSRAGTALALVAILLSLWLIRAAAVGAPDRRRRRWWWLVPSGLAVLFALMVAASLMTSQASSLYRVVEGAAAGDLRMRVLGPVLALARDGFPIGYGFGSFDLLFKTVEPDALLDPSYLNQAHNDLAQLTIEAGLPGLLLLLLFGVWFGRRSVRAWSRREGSRPAIQLARLGSIIILILLLASTVDYPLRTPFGMVLFALAAGWLGAATPGRLSARRGDGEDEDSGVAGAGSGALQPRGSHLQAALISPPK